MKRFVGFQSGRPVLIALLALLLPACNLIPDGIGEPEDPPENYVEAQELWESKGLDDYRFDFERWCFCGPSTLSATVIVRQDTVYDFKDLVGDGERIDADEYDIDRDHFLSVEELFVRIEETDPELRQELRFDAELGYPRKASLGNFALDGGVTYELDGVIDFGSQ